MFYQLEEETGSAEEQLVSNKVDGYTIIKAVGYFLLLFYYW
ncbi:MAG: hypothetical protein WKF91_00925 [Segetibacter sp.]